MSHIKLFLVAATLFAGSASTLRAESVLALNSPDYSAPAVGASSITVPSGDSMVPAVVALSPGVEIPARDTGKVQPEEVKAEFIPSVPDLGLAPSRPAAHRARARSSCAHHYRSARVAKRAVQPRVAAPRAPPWRAAPAAVQCSRCWTVVLLGVGY